MQIYGQIATLFDSFLNPEDMRKDLSFVVCRTASKDVSVLEHRLEWRRIPKLQRIRRLHIVMSVDQNGATPGLMFIARPNDRVPPRRNKLCFQTNAGKFLHQPSSAFHQLFLVFVVGRNTRKPQERIILFKIIVTHGPKPNRFSQFAYDF